MKKIVATIGLALVGLLISAAEIEPLPGGAFRVEHALFKVTRYTANWAGMVYPGEEEGNHLKLSRHDDNWNYTFVSTPAAPTASLSLQMTIPAYRFFGKPVVINDEIEFLYPE